MIAALAFAAVTAAMPPPPPPELWRGARVGATLPEVQEMFPQGKPATGLGVEGGAAPAWTTDEPVYGWPGTAVFYFANGRLGEVLVALRDLKPRHTKDNLATARSLEQALSSYYGRPAKCVDSSREGMARLDCTWTARGVRVGLSYQDLGGSSPELDVAVRPVGAKPVEKGAIFGHHARRG